jgi:hypothetical protein
MLCVFVCLCHLEKALQGRACNLGLLSGCREGVSFELTPLVWTLLIISQSCMVDTLFKMSGASVELSAAVGSS